MVFTAKSTTQAEFDQWVSQVKQSPKQLTLESYKQVLQQSENNPAEYFQLLQVDLFDRILMKYMMPMNE